MSNVFPFFHQLTTGFILDGQQVHNLLQTELTLIVNTIIYVLHYIIISPLNTSSHVLFTVK